MKYNVAFVSKSSGKLIMYEKARFEAFFVVLLFLGALLVIGWIVLDVVA